MKKRHTEPPPRNFHTLEGWCTSVNQKSEVVTSAPRKFEDPEFETGREHHEVAEEELGTHRAVPGSCFHTQFEIECTIERRRSLDIEVRIPIACGAGVAVDTVDLQIPKVRELTNEIKDLFVISPWRFKFQGFQGPQKRPEVFFHLWDK